jgi:enoyl-CoA hydratase
MTTALSSVLVEFQTVATDSAAAIAIITFNRPQARNALDLATMQQFADIVQNLTAQCVASTDLRCVILTGAGDTAFCSGGDLLELSRYPTEADAVSFITLMGDSLLRLERLPVPVIAAINGYALGGGSEIAVACDLRIVDQTARMGFVQIKLALTPGWGAGQRLLRLVGYPKALDILLRGEAMSHEQLVELGLVNQVVDTGQALSAALDYARQIAVQPPDVVRSIKALLQAGLNQSYETALRTERDLFPALWAAEPHLDAVKRFLERKQSR